MKKLILLNNKSSDQDASNKETIIASLPEVESVSIVSDASQIEELLAMAIEEDIIMADMTMLNYPEQLAQAISAERGYDMMLFQPSAAGHEGHSEFITADSLVSLIVASEQPHLLVISANKKTLIGTQQSSDQCSSETIARYMISAVGQLYSVAISSGQMTFPGDIEFDSRLTNNQIAAMLSFALNSVNIEELFPSYAWADFEKESAAACFHTLAAHFLRLGDTPSAEECLAMSEGLEDSPRALALRAMIFKQQGQTLGAVANLVSSLQQYENRKKNTEQQHYLSFSPSDLEVVNTNLQKGLSALNKHQNDQAFDHFVTAVFNFDDFYQKTGISRIKQ